MTKTSLAATLALALAASSGAAIAGGEGGEGGGPSDEPWFPLPEECPSDPDWDGLLKRVKDDADFYKRFSKAANAAGDYVKGRIPLPGKDEAELAAKLGDALFGPCK